MVAVTDRGVTYASDGCKPGYYDVIIRYTITESEGVYDWAEYVQSTTTMAQLKTAIGLQVDAMEAKIEAHMDLDVT